MVSFTPQRYTHLWESIPVFIEVEVGTEKNFWPAANRTTIPRTSSP